MAINTYVLLGKEDTSLEQLYSSGFNEKDYNLIVATLPGFNNQESNRNSKMRTLYYFTKPHIRTDHTTYMKSGRLQDRKIFINSKVNK